MAPRHSATRWLQALGHPTLLRSQHPRPPPPSPSPHPGAKGSFGERAAAFLLAQRLPAYMEFSQANANAIFGSGVDKHVSCVVLL